MQKWSVGKDSSQLVSLNVLIRIQAVKQSLPQLARSAIKKSGRTDYKAAKINELLYTKFDHGSLVKLIWFICAPIDDF